MTRTGGTGIGAQMRGIVGALEGRNPEFSAAARVRAAWERSVDPRVRPHVVSVYVVPGTGASEVVVYTDSPIWASELGMQSELLRLGLNVELARAQVPAGGGPSGEGQVRKLRFVPSKEKYLSRERRESTAELLADETAGLSAVEPVPLSDEESSALEAAASGISDERLRRAALDAARASLEWRHGVDAARDDGRENS